MLAQSSPREAYGRVELDARVAGSGPRELAALCYERLAAGISAAIHADARSDAGARSHALTRALTALTALQIGVDGAAPVGDALNRFYHAARNALLDSAVRFDSATLGLVRRDVLEIAAALTGIASNSEH